MESYYWIALVIQGVFLLLLGTLFCWIVNGAIGDLYRGRQHKGRATFFKLLCFLAIVFFLYKIFSVESGYTASEVLRAVEEKYINQP